MCLTFLQQGPGTEDGCPAPVRQQALTEPNLLLSRLLEKGASLGAGLQRRALYSDTTFSSQKDASHSCTPRESSRNGSFLMGQFIGGRPSDLFKETPSFANVSFLNSVQMAA